MESLFNEPVCEEHTSNDFTLDMLNSELALPLYLKHKELYNQPYTRFTQDTFNISLSVLHNIKSKIIT